MLAGGAAIAILLHNSHFLALFYAQQAQKRLVQQRAASTPFDGKALRRSVERGCNKGADALFDQLAAFRPIDHDGPLSVDPFLWLAAAQRLCPGRFAKVWNLAQAERQLV